MSLLAQFADLGQLEGGRFVYAASLARDLAALRDGAAVPLLASAVLQASGADRLDFVQGQLSNDVKSLPEGGVTHALMLNHKGHALADVRVLRGAEALWLVVEDGQGERVRQQLEAHIIFDAVELAPAELCHLTLQGARVPAVLAELGATLSEGRAVTTDMGLCFPCRRTAWGGADLLVPPDKLTPLLARLAASGVPLAGEAALTAARIAAGIPAAATEAGEGVLPQEAGLEQAVSYRKGCYLGQEIMARIEARGKLRRALARLRFDDADVSGLAVGAEVTQEGKAVGRLGACAHHPELGAIALAVVRNDLTSDRVQVGALAARLELLS